MGTAHPVVGGRRKPRFSRPGLVDAVGATTSPVYLSVVGAGQPPYDLGDGTNGWTFQAADQRS